MRRPRPPFVLGIAVAALAGAGCILLVNDDPSKLTTTCHFADDQTVCGLCISSACAAPLDACCGNEGCSQTTLPLLGLCFSEGSIACDAALSGAPDLASCIATACPACTAGQQDAGGTSGDDTGGGADAQPGSTSCDTAGDSCFCTVSASPNGATCTAAAVKGGGLCCASYGWPQATDATCSCEPFSCMPTSSGGTCSLSTNSTGTTTWGGDGCCTYGTFCDCNPGETCPATAVTQCDITTVGCGSSQVQVTSCSF